MRYSRKSRRLSRLGQAVLLASAALASKAAFSAASAIEELVVLGTRVEARTATEVPVPVDIIRSEALTKNGFTELGQSLQATAPSFNFSRTQVSDGGDLYRPATLRGLQPDQTLVLINGKRRHKQAIFQTANTIGGGAAGTDMNAIPLAALKAAEVLRDGAAAQYGSDAIAGVINLQLKDSVDETSGFVQWGQTGEGDGDTLSTALNTGFALNGGGFVNLSLEYRDFDSTNRARPGWFQGDAQGEFKTLFYNAAIPAGAGELYSFGGYSERSALGRGFRRAANSAAQNVPQVFPNGFLPQIANEAEDLSLAFGYRQDWREKWNMDASVVYGKNEYGFSSKNTINASIAAEFLRDNPGASDAEIAANSGPNEGFSGGRGFAQLTFNLDFSGSVELQDNPLYVAFGAEYRDESADSEAGIPASFSCGTSATPQAIRAVIPGGFAGCGFQAFSGISANEVVDVSRDSFALYLDLERNFTESWLLGAAVRYEDYSDFGDEIASKLTSRIELSEAFALRGALATGFRAPALQQSSFQAFQTNISPAGVLERSFTASSGSPFPRSVGVEGLKFETSTHISVGFVWQPIERSTLTVDAYNVAIDDRIVLGDLVTRDAVAGNAAATAVLNQLGVNGISFFSNAANTSTRGIDIIYSHYMPFARGDLDITAALNFNDTDIDSFNVPAGSSDAVVFPPQNRDFLTGGQPQERATFTFDWRKDAFNSTLRLNYFGKTEVGFFARRHIPIPGTRPTSVVDSALLVDINLAYSFNERFTVSVGGNNIFDETPRELDAMDVLNLISAGPNNGFRFPIRAVPYGFNGASYYMKLAFKL